MFTLEEIKLLGKEARRKSETTTGVEQSEWFNILVKLKVAGKEILTNKAQKESLNIKKDNISNNKIVTNYQIPKHIMDETQTEENLIMKINFINLSTDIGARNLVLINLINTMLDMPYNLLFRYTDKKGVTSEREVQPIELKGDNLFGYCLDRQAIRQFNISNIEQVYIINRKEDHRITK